MQTMLARMMSLLGPLPRHMVEGGREARRYIAHAAHAPTDDDDDGSGATTTASGGVQSPQPQWVVYERLPVASEREAELLEAAAGVPPPARGYALLRPRPTTLASRLGGPSAVATGACAPDAADPGFLDFLACLLALDPAERPSAVQALRHPWLTTAHGGRQEPIEAYVLPAPGGGVAPATAAAAGDPADTAESA
jgi:serine/threonine protein kinase